MTKKLKLLIIASVFVFPPSISAGTAEGFVDTITMTPEQVGIFSIEAHLTDIKMAVIPECFTNNKKKFAWDATTPYGRDVWDMVRLAYGTGYRVRIEFDGIECGPEGRRLKLLRIVLL